ncbi:MAG: glycosyltransferase family 1 protein [Anaerolineae bacterium]|nr:glycosyltransferase family 4 protein [Anaerolineae bacterium]MDW8098985.1 glycosyltransferase family 1 protein [Anaerolineae bacterium]
MEAVDREQAPARVGLNAQLLSLSETYRSAGIHRYIWHLLQALPAAAPGWQLMAFVGDRRFRPPLGLQTRYARWPTASPWARILWEQAIQPWLAWRERLHLLHALAYVAPLVVHCPTVVTVHDLSFVRYPEAFRPLNRLYLRVMTRRSVFQARRVIADSCSTRDDLVRLWGVPVDRISVVPIGVADEYRPASAVEAERFRRQRGLPDRFVLYLGTLEPRKNVTAAIEAFARWVKATGDRQVRLVVAGAKGWYFQTIFARVRALSLGDRVLFPGYVPAAELPAWYQAAEVFIYPSLYEGFGLPPLEAMACGTPVITSNTSSLPEVVGDAALLVDPYDVEAIAEALARLLEDAELRQRLREAGLARARLFSWERTARETVAAYRLALGQDSSDQ